MIGIAQRLFFFMEWNGWVFFLSFLSCYSGWSVMNCLYEGWMDGRIWNGDSVVLVCCLNSIGTMGYIVFKSWIVGHGMAWRNRYYIRGYWMDEMAVGMYLDGRMNWCRHCCVEEGNLGIGFIKNDWRNGNIGVMQARVNGYECKVFRDITRAWDLSLFFYESTSLIGGLM